MTQEYNSSILIAFAVSFFMMVAAYSIISDMWRVGSLGRNKGVEYKKKDVNGLWATSVLSQLIGIQDIVIQKVKDN